jgi:retron-type reverse transcriptase
MALINMIDSVSQELDNNNECIGIFIDLSKAFDTLDHNILLQKLNMYGIRGIANTWFTSYLTNRHQFVEINKIRLESLKISCGVPQGSILGPLLFIIYINDLACATNLAKVMMFADDTNLFFSGCNSTELVKIVNAELESINKWFKLNKLSLNVKKTNFIKFGNKSANSKMPDI